MENSTEQIEKVLFESESFITDVQDSEFTARVFIKGEGDEEWTFYSSTVPEEDRSKIILGAYVTIKIVASGHFIEDGNTKIVFEFLQLPPWTAEEIEASETYAKELEELFRCDK